MIQTEFDIDKLKTNFLINKKIDIKKIYEKISKRFSYEEFNNFSFVGFYKRKKHVVLIVFTNEKIFIDDLKNKAPFAGVYTYKEILKIDFIENIKNGNLSCIELKTTNEYEVIKIKGVSKYEFDEINFNFNKLKKNYIEFSKNQKSSYFSSTDKTKLIFSETKQKDLLINNNDNEELKNKESTLIGQQVDNQENLKQKKVVIDSSISKSNTYSSAYLSSLFLAVDQKLPNGQNTLFYHLANQIQKLNEYNLTTTSIDSIPLKVDRKTLKLNTIPIVTEHHDLENSDNKKIKFLLTRNWIEYTKHDVREKVLGVDENGNGAYLDFSNITSTHKISTYKGREYKVKDQVRTGLRSSQTIRAYGKKGMTGIDSLYQNRDSKKSLDIKKYDGIIFMGIKYYFKVFNEFKSLQKDFLRIFFEEKKSSGEVYRRYELIFEDELISYKAFNEKGILINDFDPKASSYDLKWLTFFKE